MKVTGNFFWLSLLVAILICDNCINCAITLNGMECIGSTKCFAHIPNNIPENVTRVILHDVLNVEIIQKGAFDGRNWDKVKYLMIFKTPQSETRRKTDQDSQSVQPMAKYIKSIEAYGMEKLTRLEELHIESNSFQGLDYGSFAGLSRLKVLSFKTCEYLMLESIVKAINGSDTVPNLHTLSMTYINTESGVNLDKDTLSVISTKPLQLLDMHKILVNNVQIKYFRGPIMNSLKICNASGITLNQFESDDSVSFKQPQLFNLSFVTLPMGMFRFTKFAFSLLSNSEFPLDMVNSTIYANVESLDLSNVNQLPLVLKNVTILLLNTKHDEWRIKNLLFRGNNLHHLDVTIPCTNSSLEMIDLSYNGINFFSPTICTCCFYLKKIILSYNQLSKMYELNSSLFSQIFNNYHRLEEIYLTSNELNSIPKALFQQNNLLQVIDLSHNRLEQVRFRLLHMKKLKLLNLQNNKITMFDITSLNNLNSFQPNAYWHLDVRYNPVSCSKCDNLQTIQWLAASDSIIRYKPDLVCVNDNDNFVPVDRNAVTFVKEICDRDTKTRNIILLVTFVPVTLIISIIAITYSIFKYHKYKQNAVNMAEKIRLIQADAIGTKFIVFIIFCSDDEEFVSTYVYPPMNQCLQRIVGTNRDLVTYGDKQFRPGQPINDEIVRCLEQSSVIIMILSKNFCSSEYCRIEFDHAQRMNKPIILMLKETVSEKDMVPSLCTIFRTNTRILWEKQDDYHLKTTWENVCTSILELVQIEQTHQERETHI